MWCYFWSTKTGTFSRCVRFVKSIHSIPRQPLWGFDAAAGCLVPCPSGRSGMGAVVKWWSLQWHPTCWWKSSFCKDFLDRWNLTMGFFCQLYLHHLPREYVFIDNFDESTPMELDDHLRNLLLQSMNSPIIENVLDPTPTQLYWGGSHSSQFQGGWWNQWQISAEMVEIM